MSKLPVILATVLCASSALATPSTGADDGEAQASNGPEVTRTVALWTHGITGAASLVGAAVYGIRGLQNSDLSGYDDDCQRCGR